MDSTHRRSRKFALSLRLAASVATVALGPVAQAQTATTQQADTSTLETIEVTGSLIREPNAVAPSPVVTVNSQELQREGIVNVEDLLNNLPSTTPDQTSSVSNGSTGTATVNLRGLGAEETLVLIDGKRIGPGDAGSGSSAADLNFIPAAMVESVDILTGGASVDYGSDAVAGVVNFKLKQDFQGVEIDQTFKIAQHTNANPTADQFLATAPYKVQVPGDQLDGFERESSLIFGINGDSGKSNVTLYLTDEHLDPVLESSRDYSECTVAGDYNAAGTLANVIGCGGSSTTPYIRTLPLANPASNPNGYIVNPNGTNTYVPFNSAYVYNYGALNYLQREDDRYTGGGMAHYDIADWATLYASAMFMDDHTSAQIAGSGLFFGDDEFMVNCNNPLASAQQLSILGCAKGSTALVPAYIGYRATQEPRTSTFRHTDYRLVVGAKGEFYPDWTYDVSAKYWLSSYQDSETGYFSVNNINNALNVVSSPTGPVCASGGSCVPLNIFKLNGVTAAQLAYVVVPGISTGSTSETTANATINGDFGQWGGKSPLATNPVAVAFGYEYRYDNLTYSPDYEDQIGDLSGSGGQSPPVNGSVDDNEFFGELQIPVIEDLPFAKLVDLQTGFRYGHYSVYGTPNTFNTDTFKIQGDYAPSSDIRFRGGFNRAERAPSTEELFLPQSFGTLGLQDPCAGTSPSASLAACEHSGVTPAEYGRVPQCSAGQCTGLYGGNTALKPETAETWTWGAVVTPRVLPGLLFSADYFDIQVDNEISSAGNFATGTLASCLGGSTAACAQVHRGPGGSLTGTSLSGGYVDAGEVNAGTELQQGLDFEIAYSQKLDDLGLENAGALRLDFKGTYLMNFTQPFGFGGNFNCAGLFGPDCANPNPTWRHQARLTWESPWDASFSVLWRHISSVKNENTTTNPILENDTYGVPDLLSESINQFNYFDLDVSWKVKPNVTLTAGVTNVFDKDPPIIDSNLYNAGVLNGNTWVGTYDTLGRVLFVSVSAKF